MSEGSPVGTEGRSCLFVSHPSRVDEGARQLFALTSAVFDVAFFTQVNVKFSIFSSTSVIFVRMCLVASFVLVRLVLTYSLKGFSVFVIILVVIAPLLVLLLNRTESL